ncbi:MAG: amidohydrolase family protein [Gemmatimonadota bacterium]
MRPTRLATVLVGVAALTACAEAPPSEASYDLVIRGGTVLDGSGLPRFSADVGIVGDRIVALGALSGARGVEEIDATGRFVAPGFINLHSHAEREALPTAVNMLTQGVTMEVLNPDGGGPTEVAAQLDSLERAGLAVHVGAEVPFNSIWARVVGTEDRRPTPTDVEAMRAAVLRGLEEGAWGVSAGLDYKPAYFARTEEVVRILEPAGPARVHFTNHDRLTPESNFSSRVGIGETLTIGERTGLNPVVTHMKVQGLEQGGAGEILHAMTRTTADGTYAAADAYPYLAGQTSLAALIIPGWAQAGGVEAMLARFADPAQRARIVREADEAMAARFGGPAGVYLPASNQELVDIMRDLGVESGGEAVVRVLERETRVGAILRFGLESDLVEILRHPTTAVACDCGAATGRVGHPRYWGSFPRVLGHYVRETGALTWEDAVRKMTGLPATLLGAVDRGFLAEGMAADVVVFDSAAVIDRATWTDPALRSEGIVHVVVGGAVALRDGDPTGARGGRALRRGPGMPSRPMSSDRDRAVRATGAGPLEAAVDVRQGSTERQAEGTFRLAHPTDGVAVVAQRLGRLQTAPGWASFTGVATVGDDPRPHAFVAVVQAADGEQPPLLRVHVEGLPAVEGALDPAPVIEGTGR